MSDIEKYSKDDKQVQRYQQGPQNALTTQNKTTNAVTKHEPESQKFVDVELPPVKQSPPAQKPPKQKDNKPGLLGDILNKAWKLRKIIGALVLPAVLIGTGYWNNFHRGEDYKFSGKDKPRVDNLDQHVKVKNQFGQQEKQDGFVVSYQAAGADGLAAQVNETYADVTNVPKTTLKDMVSNGKSIVVLEFSDHAVKKTYNAYDNIKGNEKEVVYEFSTNMTYGEHPVQKLFRGVEVSVDTVGGAKPKLHHGAEPSLDTLGAFKPAPRGPR